VGVKFESELIGCFCRSMYDSLQYAFKRLPGMAVPSAVAWAGVPNLRNLTRAAGPVAVLTNCMAGLLWWMYDLRVVDV
jgi:hypothetical protein